MAPPSPSPVILRMGRALASANSLDALEPTVRILLAQPEHQRLEGFAGAATEVVDSAAVALETLGAETMCSGLRNHRLPNWLKRDLRELDSAAAFLRHPGSAGKLVRQLFGWTECRAKGRDEQRWTEQQWRDWWYSFSATSCSEEPAAQLEHDPFLREGCDPWAGKTPPAVRQDPPGEADAWSAYRPQAGGDKQPTLATDPPPDANVPLHAEGGPPDEQALGAAAPPSTPRARADCEDADGSREDGGHQSASVEGELEAPELNDSASHSGAEAPAAPMGEQQGGPLDEGTASDGDDSDSDPEPPDWATVGAEVSIMVGPRRGCQVVVTGVERSNGFVSAPRSGRRRATSDSYAWDELAPV